MIVEVDGNPNCESGIFARFKEAAPAKRVIQVKSYDRRAEGEWCWVTGWSDSAEQPHCPAYAQLVEDSGAGLSHLIFGGLWGIRLKPVSLKEEWDLESRNQWGEPYLLLADAKDIVFEDAVKRSEEP